MSRRVASQVHKQASRLLREGYLRREPAWYQAVLDHPPLPLPAKAPASRSAFDLPEEVPEKVSLKNRPLPIQYIEDGIRRQFFSDHPFEAFRPTSLVEGATIEDEHPIRGLEWTRLRQRGRNPTPEDAIRFAVNLHIHHNVALTRAYSTAVAQFRSLRAEQQSARRFALLEARHYGIELGPSQVDIVFDKEEKALDSWRKSHELNSGENAAKKRWKAIMEREGSPGSWTKGQEYVRLWQEGIRPTYAPLLTEPTITPEGLTGLTPDTIAETPLNDKEILVRRADFVGFYNTTP